MAGYTIVGWTSDDKVPGFVGETVFGAGKVSAGSLPFYCLVVGQMTTGTATPNQDVLLVQSSNDADTFFGPGSELARMCYAALLETGVTLYAAPNAVGGSSPTAGTLTITIAGTWTTQGQWTVRVAGLTYSGTIAPTDTVTLVATAIVAAIQADTRSPVTAANTAGVVTITSKNTNARANFIGVFQDTSALPAGCTSTLGGTGSALTGGGKRLGGGTDGGESLATMLGILSPARYHRIAVAHNTAGALYSTSGGNWRDFLATQAGPLVGLMEHLVWGDTSASQPTSLNTLVNDQRMCGLWLQNGETVPSEMAARFAAKRAVVEQSAPNTNYDDVILTGIAPQSQKVDWPTHTVSKSCLNNGITPLSTTPDGKVKIVRAITSHSLNGAVPDYRTLDVAQSAVPDYCRDDLSLLYTQTVKPANPYNDADPNIALGEPTRPAGVLTPTDWNNEVIAEQKIWERANLITDLANNVPSSIYDPTTNRTMTQMPIKVRPQNHQLGVSVRQIAS